MSKEIRQLWNNGPLKEWSDKRESNAYIPYAKGGFTRQYVCMMCHNPVVGVYRLKDNSWVCSGCKRG